MFLFLDGDRKVQIRKRPDECELDVVPQASSNHVAVVVRHGLGDREVRDEEVQEECRTCISGSSMDHREIQHQQGRMLIILFLTHNLKLLFTNNLPL